ncbi:HYR domain-containing protein [Maribellus luteus]|uniref:HYR domain-containing protein n=1 Tax=Maribellus luteus TaxID=2305463 RepID=A0A399T0Y6_9BACT|nr:HYR domain-containing protein [Maribellus luteus]RIJ49966.1 HYR domain-containing protein [Maribellus luteus]
MIVSLSVFIDPTSVKAGVLRAGEGGSVDIVTGGYEAPDNIHFSKISGNNAFPDDTIGIVCPENISTYTDVNACNTLISSGLELIDRGNTIASLSWQMEGATEGSSSASGINQLTSYVFNEGTTLVTYRGRDRSNQSVFCSFTVVVADNEIPRLMNPPGNISVEADPGDCHAVVNWQEPIVLDNCASRDQIIVDANYMPGSAFPIGTTEVFFSISDGVEYNRDEYSFTVTVTDNEKPEIYAPHPIRVKCGDPVPEAFTSWREFTEGGGVAFDNCNIEVESFRFVGQKSNGIRCPYTVTRTYSIADDYGNITEVEHLVYVTGEEEAQEEPQPELVLKSAMADCEAIYSGNWNVDSIWSCGHVPTSADNVTIPNGFTVTVNTTATCNNISIEGGGEVNHGATLATTLQVYGSWTNSGTYNGGTNGVVEFIGSNPASISGTTNFEGLVINKGSLSTTLTISGTAAVLSSGLLTMTSGLVTIPGTGSFSVNPAIGLTIEQAAGFDVTGGSLSTGNFTITNNGLIRINSGTANFGINSGNTVHTQNHGAFIVSNGSVDIAGRLESTADGTLSPPGLNSGITISGGIVSLSTAGNNLSGVGSLNVTSSGDFYFTGGTIIFQNPSTATTELDLGLISGTGTKNTVGGTFQFGNTSTPGGSVFNISSEIPLDHITSSANADLLLEGDLLVRDLDLNSATTINLNGNSLLQQVTGTGTYSFPLVDGSGNDISVDINLSSVGSLGANPYIEVTTTDNKFSPQNASATNFLSRYWTVTLNDINGPNYSVSADFPTADISGTQSEIAAGVWTGSIPWIKGSAASGNTISSGAITTGGTIIFTGITLDAPSVSINNGAASEEICTGSSVVLTAVPTGDPGWTYSWSPSTGLSATNIAAPTASPTSDQTYTVTVTDGNGFTAQDQITVNVDPVSVGGTVNGSATVCSGVNSTTLTLTGEVGAVQRWEYSTNGGSNWTTIPNTTTSYTATNLTQTTMYRAVVQSGVCNEANSVEATITVDPVSVGGTASANQTICDGSSPADLTLTGHVGSIQWQWSPNGTSSWTDITGAVGSTLTSVDMGSLNADRYYRAEVTSGVCSPAYSNTVVISVDPTSVGGTASANQTICDGSSPADLTLSGSVGSIQWQWSSDGTSSWTDIGGATGSTLTSAQMGSLSANRYYRAQVTSGVCAAAYSTVVLITVNSTPSVNTVSDQEICHGTNTTAINFTGTATSYEWTNDQPSIGLVASGTGSIAAFNASNTGNVPVIATIEVTPVYTNNGVSCSGTPESFTITVNPIPTVSASPATQQICPGDNIAISIANPNSVAGTTYSWTRDNTTTLTGLESGTGNTISGMISSSNPGTLETTTFTITATANGCSSQTTVQVIVGDDTDPTVASCPGNISVGADPGSCTAVVSYTLPAFDDNCDGNGLPGTLTAGLASGQAFSVGITTVTYEFTDAAGNGPVECSFTVTVSDNEAPVITCPANITVDNSPGFCYATAASFTITPPVATDNCNPDPSETPSRSDGLAMNASFPVGVTTITWTASDGTNTSTCTQTITVIDNEDPTFTAPANITIYTDANCNANSDPVQTGNPINLKDNCTASVNLNSGYTDGANVPGSCSGNYSFTRTWTVTDAAGNSTSKDQIITVSDITKPTISVPPNVSIACSDSQDPDDTGWATATDNCAVDSIFYSDSTGTPAVSCASNYTIFRKWVAEDECGNQRSGVQRITVSDTKGPEVVFSNQVINVQCPDDIPVYYENLAQFLASNASNDAYDLCGGSVTMQLYDEYSVFDPGTSDAGYCPESVVRKYRFYDECLNYTEVEQVIYVNDLSNCECTECTDKVEVFNVDLRTDPDSLWAVYDVRKDKGARCCLDDVWWEDGGKDPYRCVSFNVIIDDGAVGVQIKTSKGQDSKEWRVDCEQVSLEGPDGDIICLPSGEYHLFSHCKQGSDPIDYFIQSVAGIIASDDISTRVDCSNQIHTTGDFESAPVWSALNPAYDKYLDVSDPYNPVFYVPLEDKDLVPAAIQYQVCADVVGYICGQSNDGTICDTITVHVLPPIEIELNIDPTLICEDDPLTLVADVSPSSIYYQWRWFNGPDASGSVISTSNTLSLTPPVALGTYSVQVTDYDPSGLMCNVAVYNFEVEADTTGASVFSPTDDLTIQCNDPDAAQLIQDWLATATAQNDDGTPLDVTNNYSGITLACNVVLPVVFSAEDICGNVGADTAYIYVIDTIAPVISPESFDQITDCNTLDKNTHPDYLAWLNNNGGAAATDDCDHPDSLTWTNNATTQAWVGDGARDSITVTFTVTDDCGNADSTTATFTIVDDEPPTITCPGDVLEEAAPDSCSKIPDTLEDPVYADSCSVPDITWTSTGALVSSGNGIITGVSFPVGTTTVTYRATDAAGLIAECDFTVTIVDVTPPNLEISNCVDVTGTMDATNCFAEPPTILDPLYSDDCWPNDSLVLAFTIETEGGLWDTTGFGYVSDLNFPVGVSTVTYTVTDPDSNMVSCSFTVTMLRDEIPWTAITCPSDPPAVVLGSTECERSISLTPPTVDDYCVTATYTITNDFNNDSVIINEVFPVGTTEVNWTITDNSGNDTTCTVYVVVTGIQLPTITCPSDVEGQMTADDCFALPPAIGSPSYSAPCWDTDSLDLSFRIINGAWDTTGVGEVNGLEFPAGINTVWYIVSDPDGNKDSCDFTVSMLRDEIPSSAIVCPPNPPSVTLGANECDATLSLPQPTINETCTTVVYSFTNNYNNDSVIVNETFPTGTTEVTWYITDNSGNVDSCIVYVEVNGIQLPTITCPSDVEGQMTADDCFALPPAIGSPSYSAPCWDTDSLDLSFRIINGAWDTTGVGEVNGLEFPAGINTVWYIVSDPDGNKDSCDFTVTMLRDEIPSSVVACQADPADRFVDDSTSCDAWVDVLPPVISEECTTVVYDITHNSDYGVDSSNASGYYPIGQHRVVWYITDNSGNIDSCVHNFEVFDMLPILVCPPDVEVFADENELFATNVTVGLPTYWDNCDSVLIYTVTPPDSITTLFNGSPDSINLLTGPHTYDLGVTTIEYTFKDGNGNIVVCDFTVTVWAAPDIECPPDTTIYLDGSEADCSDTFDPGVADLIEGAPPITWTYTITFADGTSEGPVTYVKDASDPYANPLGDRTFPLGVTTIEWRAENLAGFDTCSHWIEVIDTIPPTLKAEPYENCVDPLHWAVYNPSNPNPVYNHVDPLVEKFPVDYRTMFAGDTFLDLTSLEDNCCDSVDMTINWRIDFADTPDPVTGAAVSHAPVSGTGQPSTYEEGSIPTDIYLWGDGVTFTAVTHTITYWVEDCNGNISDEIMREITITPRPKIEKQ